LDGPATTNTGSQWAEADPRLILLDAILDHRDDLSRNSQSTRSGGSHIGVDIHTHGAGPGSARPRSDLNPRVVAPRRPGAASLRRHVYWCCGTADCRYGLTERRDNERAPWVLRHGESIPGDRHRATSLDRRRIGGVRLVDASVAGARGNGTHRDP